MIWTIFTIWAIVGIACGIIAEKTEKDFLGFLFLLSVPFMFYLPLFLK